MKVTIQIKKNVEIEVKTLAIDAGVRYWEDGDPEDMPFRHHDRWQPVIDIDAGVVIGWPSGIKASIHYKVCDDGSYYLKDKDGRVVLLIKDNYVPNGLIPGEYGDYIIMTIDGSGKIAEWPEAPSLTDSWRPADE